MASFDYALACLLTVGFHFFHVVIGLILLSVAYFMLSSIPGYYIDCVV